MFEKQSRRDFLTTLAQLFMASCAQGVPAVNMQTHQIRFNRTI